jgi:hypothetical protein
VELRVEKPEEVLVPPLPEFSYVCDNEITEAKCKGVCIFRDPDFLSFTSSEVVSTMSLQGIVRSKTRGRKLERWSNYLEKYKVALDGQEFSLSLKLNLVITVYVDGYEVNGVSGDAVVKEYRLVSTKKREDSLVDLLSLKPTLVTLRRHSDYWDLITAYKVTYVDKGVLKELQKLLGVKRMECQTLEVLQGVKVCYL